MVPDTGSAASHAPIRIIGDADFTPANGVVGGTGSPSDPYIIAGWDIDAPTEPGIFIQNTDAHFVIRDVSVASSTSNPGILFSYARGGIVENATLTGNQEGISVSYSPRVVLRNNTISSSGQEGIFVWGSIGLVVSGNTVSNSTWDGIYVRYSSGARVVGNVVVDNPLDADTWQMAGIRIVESGNAWRICRDPAVPMCPPQEKGGCAARSGRGLGERPAGGLVGAARGVSGTDSRSRRSPSGTSRG